MKWYVSENAYQIMKEKDVTPEMLENDDLHEMTESDIFYQVFYLLIDLESEVFYNVQFQADGQKLTAYNRKHHVKIESPQELETYFYNMEGFSIEKLIAEYNRKFA